MSHHSQVGPNICEFQLSGGTRTTYICPRDEYCCNIGCCISPTFQFYQLWYYWFMVFFMFLVCSGGQWWYRHVMHGRCASAIAPPTRRSSYTRQARVAYTPARDTVVLHHLWKPSYPGSSVNGPPPSYSQSGTSSSSVVPLGGPKPSPYMLLYGPPPSYESVIASGPASIHSLPQISKGPSENQTGQGRNNALSQLQPVQANFAQQESSSIVLAEQQASFSQPNSSQTQQPITDTSLHQYATEPAVQDEPNSALVGPQQSLSSFTNTSQNP